MIIFKRPHQLQEWVARQKRNSLEVGFVPTMGALHEGHLSLTRESIEACDVTVVSIFVNPKQFNDPQDLIKYPRPIEEDLRLLIQNEVDVLFLPDVEDIYPADATAPVHFNTGPLGDVMEGKFRPGHFDGVAEVMYRLLTIVAPDKLFMGQKDYQQVAIIRKLITNTQLPSVLIMCPTLREANGLAMSSRNTRLSPQAREKAGIISFVLSEAQKRFESGEDVPNIQKDALQQLSMPDFQPEYFSIIDGIDLTEIKDQNDSQFVVACTAVRVEDVRLIDNMIWTKSE